MLSPCVHVIRCAIAVTTARVAEAVVKHEHDGQRGMGCCASSPTAGETPTARGRPTQPVVVQLASRQLRRSPDDFEAAAAAVLAVLEAIERMPRVALPLLPHARRIPSGARGVSDAFLEAVRRLYLARGGLASTMEDVCKSIPACVCALTAGTGLSLAESVAFVAERDGLALARAAVGESSTFFSYSWTGTKLEDMLGAIEDTAARVARPDGKGRHVWIDMFCASQAGALARSHAAQPPATGRARPARALLPRAPRALPPRARPALSCAEPAGGRLPRRRHLPEGDGRVQGAQGGHGQHL